MEKYGVKNDILHTELRDEEAKLMAKMAEYMGDTSKTASDRSALEKKLQDIRNKITELDMT